MDPMSFLTLSASYFPPNLNTETSHLLDSPAAISEGDTRKNVILEADGYHLIYVYISVLEAEALLCMDLAGRLTGRLFINVDG